MRIEKSFSIFAQQHFVNYNALAAQVIVKVLPAPVVIGPPSEKLPSVLCSSSSDATSLLPV